MTETGTRIRALRPGDIPAAVRIALRAWEPIFAQYRETFGEALFLHLFGPCWQDRKAAEVRDRAEAEPDAFIVAECNGDVVGFASWRLDRATRTAEIMNNAVDPEWQGRGIAGRLYARMLEHFRQEGMEFAMVETGGDPAHAPAVRAYAKAGFTIREDVVRMYRTLDSA